jgi:hypothetical protein
MMRSVLKSLLLTSVVSCALAATVSAVVLMDTNPDGSINTGDFQKFTALTSGDLSDTNNTLTGDSLIQGNVGIGGKGNFSMSAGTVNGDIYMNSFGKFTKSGPAQHNGNVFLNQEPVLNPALKDARDLSTLAGNETSTANYTVNGNPQVLTTVNTNKDTTVMANPFATKVVLNLQDFVLTGGTFTLSGNVNQTFIINVSRNFSLNNASVVLAGGIMSSHILFNIKGPGSQVSLNQGTKLYGIVVATQRKVSLAGGKVFGKVVAEQLSLSGGGQIVSQ